MLQLLAEMELFFRVATRNARQLIKMKLAFTLLLQRLANHIQT